MGLDPARRSSSSTRPSASESTGATVTACWTAATVVSGVAVDSPGM
jgi:hypothetical protein